MSEDNDNNMSQNNARDINQNKVNVKSLESSPHKDNHITCDSKIDAKDNNHIVDKVSCLTNNNYNNSNYEQIANNASPSPNQLKSKPVNANQYPNSPQDVGDDESENKINSVNVSAN